MEIIFQCDVRVILSIIITPTNQRCRLDADGSIEMFFFLVSLSNYLTQSPGIKSNRIDFVLKTISNNLFNDLKTNVLCRHAMKWHSIWSRRGAF